MVFDSLRELLRVLIVGVFSYAGLIVLLRLSGKRTLAKMNAFDLVVTVALGSTLATILLSSDVAYVEGLLALGLLAALQFVAAWLAVRWRLARRVLKSRPALLVRDGRLLPDTLRRERVTAGEIRQAIRSQGMGSIANVAAVVLETDGTFSVVSRPHVGDGSALADVFGEWEPDQRGKSSAA